MDPSQSRRSSSAKGSAQDKSESQHEAVGSKRSSRSSSPTRPIHETSDLPEHKKSNELDADAIQQVAAADDNANPSESEKKDEDAPKRPEPLRGIALWSATAGLVCAVFVVQLNSEIVATAIPSITNYFNSITDIGYYGSAFMLANCVLQPLAGRIYTHQSLKGSFLGFLLVFEIGNLICGLATSSNMLIGGRVISGAGSAGVVNGCLAIIAHIAPIEKRPILVAMIANISRIGVIFGPLLGGVLSEKASWRWVFLINCPLGVAVMAAIYFIKMPEREDKHNIKHSLKSFLGALDLPGFSIFCPSIVMMLLALEWGGVTFAWNSAIIIGLFCGSGVIFLIFIAWEYRVGDKAMIPLKLLRNRVVSLGFILQILQFGCLFLISYYLPIWFQASKQASPIDSGLMTLPSLISQIAVGLAVGWLVQRLGHLTPFAIIGCIATAVGSGLMTTFQPWTGPNLWIGYQILTGSGRGLASQMSLLAVQYNVPKDQVSIGTSLLTFAGTFGATMFIAIGQTAFANLLIPAIAQFAPGVDPQRVIDAGATNLRNVAPGLDPYKIVLAYNQALTRMFFLGAGASAASLFFCLGWGDINIKKKKQEAAAKSKEKGEQNV